MNQIERRLSGHTPIGNQASRMEYMRSLALNWSAAIEQLSEPSREQSLALTKIEEALMWANKAIILGDATIEASQ